MNLAEILQRCRGKSYFCFIRVSAELVFDKKNKIKKVPEGQCDQKKSPNVYKSCPKMISLEK